MGLQIYIMIYDPNDLILHCADGWNVNIQF